MRTAKPSENEDLLMGLQETERRGGEGRARQGMRQWMDISLRGVEPGRCKAGRRAVGAHGDDDASKDKDDGVGAELEDLPDCLHGVQDPGGDVAAADGGHEEAEGDDGEDPRDAEDVLADVEGNVGAGDGDEDLDDLCLGHHHQAGRVPASSGQQTGARTEASGMVAAEMHGEGDRREQGDVVVTIVVCEHQPQDQQEPKHQTRERPSCVSAEQSTALPASEPMGCYQGGGWVGVEDVEEQRQRGCGGMWG